MLSTRLIAVTCDIERAGQAFVTSSIYHDIDILVAQSQYVEYIDDGRLR